MPLQIRGIRVTPGQQAVFDVLKAYRPMSDAALVPLAQHMASVRQSSSSIRSRRAELVTKGLLRPRGTVKTPSGRKAKVFEAR